MRPDERRLLARLINHYFDGRLSPGEQGELREILVRHNPRAVGHDLPTLVDLGRATLGVDAIKRYALERERALDRQRTHA